MIASFAGCVPLAASSWVFLSCDVREIRGPCRLCSHPARIMLPCIAEKLYNAPASRKFPGYTAAANLLPGSHDSAMLSAAKEYLASSQKNIKEW